MIGLDYPAGRSAGVMTFRSSVTSLTGEAGALESSFAGCLRSGLLGVSIAAFVADDEAIVAILIRFTAAVMTNCLRGLCRKLGGGTRNGIDRSGTASRSLPSSTVFLCGL